MPTPTAAAVGGAGGYSICSETIAACPSEAYSPLHVNAILDIAPASASISPVLDDGLRRVVQRFREQLQSPIAPVAELCRHIERYRGKMLRPTLTLLSGLAVDPAGVQPAHITVATVIEMIHMATLVHDDVLDEADVRRGGDTVNKRRGNEAAVIFGDYLISRAFHLCSTLDSQDTALRIGEVTSIVCEGEMLQIAGAGRADLSEAEYFQIIERKTASLIGVACEQGARHAGASSALAARMGEFGLKLGAAFQIQDDLLDVLGAREVVGKPVGRDLEKGKLTLPAIHYLATIPKPARAAAADKLLRCRGEAHTEVREALERAGSTAYARQTAADLVREARSILQELAPSAARDSLDALADAVVSRRF